jgi:sugar phosphate isomerase/epimerase
MSYTRREFGKLALAGLPAVAVIGRSESILGALAQAKPNSVIDGVTIGVITYSYRSMPDQSAEATLKYVVDSGISAIELMGGPVESFAGAPASGRGGGPGAGARGRAGDGPGGGAPQQEMVVPPGSWNGKPCPAVRAPGGGRSTGSGQAGAGRGRGRGEMTPEQQAAMQEAAAKLKAWRTSVSVDPFKKLRRLYNDAGVSIYAWKQLNPNMSDEEVEYIFNVAEALGCTHTTLELPTDPAQVRRIGEFAMKKKIYASYHTHLQGSMTAFDQAFAASKGNTANIDIGHYVAAGNVGGTPIQFFEKFHDRITSFHIKDRTTPDHCALNLPFGEGETPLKEILHLLRKNKWNIPATIELEYQIPEGSDPVKEVRRSLDWCRSALTART